MVFPIVGGDGKPTGYDISNSLRFNDDDSPSLAITPGSAGNRKTFTYSGWVKRSSVENSNGQDHLFMVNGGNADDTWFQLRFEDNDLVVSSYNARMVRTDRKFQDPSAWYHIVCAVDTTQGTASNRVKLYVNNVQETSFSTTSYPSQDSNTGANGTYRHFIGAEGGTSGSGSGNFFDGYMTEVHLIDGSALDPTYFGEFDDNNEWVPKKYTGSYGTNGFFLEFKQTGTSQNASGIGADTSGNDNHFAVSNLAAVDVNTDTCTNNFATMSPQYSDAQQGGAATFTEGNLQIVTTYNSTAGLRYPQVYSTFAAQTGKYYYEMKITTSDTDSFIGIFSPEQLGYIVSNNPYGGVASTGVIYTSRGELRLNDGSTSGHGTFSQNDILGCALDIDNNKVYFHKNGTYIQSGDPAANSGGQAIPAGFFYGFSVGNETASNSGTMQVNTGNPLFTISSGNADANGFGNFEYAVPSGFFAMCTKNIGEL